MKVAIQGHLRSVDSDIRTHQTQLGSKNAELASTPSAIMGVDEKKTLIRAYDVQFGISAIQQEEESADRIEHTCKGQLRGRSLMGYSQGQHERFIIQQKCRERNVFLQRLTFSKNFDIDIPDNTKLSPGAVQIKQWVEKGNSKTGANKRTEYGKKNPAYLTAFIVAADTVLEVFESRSK
ncbi:MAG: hypothetical protein Q9222_006454 [Ikaeria aurantiellina]